MMKGIIVPLVPSPMPSVVWKWLNKTSSEVAWGAVSSQWRGGGGELRGGIPCWVPIKSTRGWRRLCIEIKCDCFDCGSQFTIEINFDWLHSLHYGASSVVNWKLRNWPKLLLLPSFSLSNLFSFSWNFPCKNNKKEQNSQLYISNSNFTMKGCTDKEAILDFSFANIPT